MPISDVAQAERMLRLRPRKLADHECRTIRLARERAALARRLQGLLAEVADAIHFDFHDLSHLAGYRVLADEGLVHVGVIRSTGTITIIAATSRVLRRQDLRVRLFALRRLAERELKRVVIATPKGIVHETARLRARRKADLGFAPAALPSADVEA